MLTETEIVNYADKRVLHDKIASLEDRMAYIVEKYGASSDIGDRIQIVWEESRSLEHKIFRHLSFSPEALSELIPEGIEDELFESR